MTPAPWWPGAGPVIVTLIVVVVSFYLLGGILFYVYSLGELRKLPEAQEQGGLTPQKRSNLVLLATAWPGVVIVVVISETFPRLKPYIQNYIETGHFR